MEALKKNICTKEQKLILNKNYIKKPVSFATMFSGNYNK